MSFTRRMCSQIGSIKQFKNPWNPASKYMVLNKNFTTEILNKEILANSAISKNNAEKRPLAVIFSWILADRRHVLKYESLYANQGFDVVRVGITPWQLLFPLSGSQVVAKNLIEFLTQRIEYDHIILHGFSVGAQVFGDVLTLLENDLKNQQLIIDRIAGQIWDSPVYFEIPEGNRRLSQALFKNSLLRKSFEKYLGFHLRIFHNVATKHYLKSASCFQNTQLKSPALIFCSEDDSMQNLESIHTFIKKWKHAGIPVTLKCWMSSPHVTHFQHHPQEYKKEMKTFLDKLGLLRFPEKFN